MSGRRDGAKTMEEFHRSVYAKKEQQDSGKRDESFMETLYGRVNSAIRAKKFGSDEEEGAGIRVRASCARGNAGAMSGDDGCLTAVLASPVNKTRVVNAAMKGDSDGSASGAGEFDSDLSPPSLEEEFMQLAKKCVTKLKMADAISEKNTALEAKLEAATKQIAALTTKNNELQDKIAVVTRTVNTFKSDSGASKQKLVSEVLEALK